MHIDSLYDFDGARNRFAKKFKILLNKKITVKNLKEKLYPFKNGEIPVHLTIRNSRIETEVVLGKEWNVSLNKELVKIFSDWLSAENIFIEYG